jgi:hypothetical protein
MFVSSNNSGRISVLTDLMKGVAKDLKEAFAVLFTSNNTTA